MTLITRITRLFSKHILSGDSMKLINVKLLKAHEHGGKTYPAGETLEVSQANADFMTERKIAQIVKKTKTEEVK
jgi:hypothetical protein